MEIKAIIRWSKAISRRGETWSALYLDLYLTSKVFAAVLLKKAVTLPSIFAIDFYFRKKHNLGLHVCKAMKSQSQGWTAFVILHIVNSYLNLRKQLLFHISIHTDKHSLKEWMCPNRLQYSKIPYLLGEKIFSYLPEVFMFEYRLWTKPDIETHGITLLFMRPNQF